MIKPIIKCYKISTQNNISIFIIKVIIVVILNKKSVYTINQFTDPISIKFQTQEEKYKLNILVNLTLPDFY